MGVDVLRANLLVLVYLLCRVGLGGIELLGRPRLVVS